ncbi:tetratricopeptide repeat protein [bacterium]|nr:tetratricopeptide repeat protein [bacterium]
MKAKRAVEKAAQLEPDRPWVHFALANFYYNCDRDYDRALQEFETFRKLRPSASPFLMGSILRRQGKWEQSLPIMIEGCKINPRSVSSASNLGMSYMWLRKYEEALRWFDRALSLDPSDIRTIHWKFQNDLLWKGQAELAVLEKGLSGRRSLNADYFAPLLYIAGRHYQAALSYVSSIPNEILDHQLAYRPKYLAYAHVYFAMGDISSARAHADSARLLTEQAVLEEPEDARRQSALGLAYAYSGKKEQAVRAGIRATELLPMTKDALIGAKMIENLAKIYTIVDEQRAAIEELRYLLSIPYDISTALLRLDPTWDRLRTHPEFQKLLEGS